MVRNLPEIDQQVSSNVDRSILTSNIRYLKESTVLLTGFLPQAREMERDE